MDISDNVCQADGEGVLWSSGGFFRVCLRKKKGLGPFCWHPAADLAQGYSSRPLAIPYFVGCSMGDGQSQVTTWRSGPAA